MSTPTSPVRLFALPDLAIDEPEPPPASYGRRLTARNNRLIAHGWHPATRQPLFVGTGERCRDCVHAFPTGRGWKNYWKCSKNPRGFTRGARTDIRLKWPACALFEPYPAEVAVDVRTGVPSEGP